MIPSPRSDLIDLVRSVRARLAVTEVDLDERETSVGLAEYLDRAERALAGRSSDPDGTRPTAAQVVADADAARREVTFLYAASNVLAEAELDEDARWRILVRLMVPDLADAAWVELAAPTPGGLRHFAHHWMPDRAEEIRAFVGAMPRIEEAGARTLETPGAEAWVVDDVASLDEETRAVLAALRPRSVVAAPVRSGGKPIARLWLVFSESHRVHGESDLRLVTDLARRASSAVETARAFRKANDETKMREDVVSIVAHDLRNPLNSIVMANRLMQEQGPSPRHMEIVGRAAHRMKRLIEDLLDVARIQDGSLVVAAAPHDVGEVMSEAIEGVQQEANTTQVLVSWDRPAGLLGHFDRDRVLQVLGNLIGNAVKFSPPGARVTVNAEPGPRGGVTFHVRDTGPGIPAEVRARIFDRGVQGTAGDRKGIGLGLHIAHGIVSAHRGRIRVESELGQGSTFSVELPGPS